MKNRPNREGIWEWFDSEGVKRLMYVCDTNKKLREKTGHAEPSLEVYWWGGYYRIEDEMGDLYDCNDRLVEKDHVEPAEWSTNWGNFVGEHGSIPDEQLYLMPTQEQLAKWKAEG